MIIPRHVYWTCHFGHFRLFIIVPCCVVFVLGLSDRESPCIGKQFLNEVCLVRTLQAEIYRFAFLKLHILFVEMNRCLNSTQQHKLITVIIVEDNSFDFF